MRWINFRRIAISLAFAIVAAVLLVSINEASYKRSTKALEAMTQTQATRSEISQLLRLMLDAETGLRGYLLTGEERYLEPYSKAITAINYNMDELRQIFIYDPQELAIFTPLARQVERKMSEMELSLRLYRQGNEEAWRFVMFTDVGMENMDAIRDYTGKLLSGIDERSAKNLQDIEHTLSLSRIGIATVTALGVLGFFMYLRQAHALQQAHQREQEIQRDERNRLEALVRERTAALRADLDHARALEDEARRALADRRETEAALVQRRKDLAALAERERLKARQAKGGADREAQRALVLAEEALDLDQLVGRLQAAGTLRAELASRGYRLANGAMLIEQGRIWHGSAAIAELHRRMQPSDALLQVLQGLFKQDDRARRMYPLMLLARRIVLAVKGCPVDPDEIRQ